MGCKEKRAIKDDFQNCSWITDIICRSRERLFGDEFVGCEAGNQ